jgi:hypothetical protein
MSTEMIATIGTLVVAVAALGITVWQGWLMRKHNRLSVKPLLRIDRNAILGFPFNIVLANVGTGPAIFREVKIFVDGELIVADRRPVIETLVRIDLNPDDVKHFTIYPDEAFESGERHPLFQTNSTINGQLELARYDSAFSRVSFTIEYASIYGEQFVFTWPKSN